MGLINTNPSNDVQALTARISALELALEGRLINLPANTLLGRNAGTGTVEQIPTTRFATPAMIDQAITDLAGGAPGALNTLMELATALNNDANFAATIANSLALKAPIANPVFTGFVTLGDNIAIKIKRLAGTTGATQGASVNIAHGLSGDKIIWFGCKVTQSASAGITSDFDTAYTGYSFDCYHDATNIVVVNSSANSTNMLSKPLTILIFYSS